jgi:lipopolysaccharide export LptBFGC system permease protein LptF
VTDDLSKASLLPPTVGAWMPALVGGMIGLVILLHQEDG